MMVLGVQQGFELEMLAWQWLYQHIPYTWPPARPGTSQAWPPASPHSYARSWPLGQGLGKVFFGGGGMGWGCCLSLTFHSIFSLPPVRQELCFLLSLAHTPLPTQLPRKAGEAGLHLAAGAWGFRESQGKV